jgi:hypothetical protein
VLANPAHPKAKRSSYGLFVLLSATLLLTLVVGLVCGWLMLQTVAGYYAARIYPNVYVLGVNLGRLSPEEATAVLDDVARRADTGLLTLCDGSAGLTTGGSAGLTASADGCWSVPWSEAGMHLDVAATVQAAFAVGHADADQRLRDQVRVWLRRHDVAPVLALDPKQAREMLERLAPSVAVSPVDATLRLPQRDEDRVVALPGQPGRELDIEATLARLLAVADGQGAGGQIDLVFRTVPPRVADVTPLQTRAEELLGRRVVLSAYDVLTDETYSWELERGDIVNWLRVESSPDGPTVGVDREAIRATLVNLSAAMGEGRGLRLEEATEQIWNAFDAGGGAVFLYLTHPSRTYAVQPGDTMSDIAATFGMPAWLILQANSGINPDWLQVGQELVIPSQDVLTPYVPVPGKRVVVSIAEQRMRVYENGALVHDWPVSTGIASSPTSSGVFQILSKEEKAYASLWDLWMPHFVAIYLAGPDFYNGIHGLPTLSSGRRLWEGLLGSPASYGCIILGLEEAETFYLWAEVGVPVVVE